MTQQRNGRKILRILIFIFCVLTGVSVAVIMFHTYRPGQNSLAALSSVCMDTICIIILYILLLSFAFAQYGITRTNSLYVGLLVATIWAVFTDFLNWAFDGSLELGQLTFWFTVCSLCMGSILACIFSLYLNSYMEDNHNFHKMRRSSRICAVLNLFSFVMTFVLALSGTAFVFVDGHYEVGALYDVITVIPVLTLVYLTCFAVRFVKTIGIHDVLAVAGYIFFMIAGALIEAGNGIGTTYVAVTIADIFIFVMLQNEVIAQEKLNVKKWMEKSNTDELTGFYNRHAYEADMTSFDNEVLGEDFVYISADVNSLKFVNDTLGHSAGDELLMGAAECLKKCFGPYGKLYRIGGDEFVAIVNMDEGLLNTGRKNIEELTQSWSGELVHTLALSCGYVPLRETEDKSVRQMAIMADKRMYEAKNEYYRLTGIERRNSHSQ